MAMTDAEKEAKILEIGELVSEISRTNQLLLDIFRAGGVSNADWAVMKAELQGWTTTQLNNVPKLNVVNEFTANQRIRDGINIINSVYSTNDTETFSVYLDNRCKNNKSIGSIYFNHTQEYNELMFRVRDNDNTVHKSISFKYLNGEGVFNAPSPSIENATATSVITKGYLDDYGNSTLHKYGKEDIYTEKTFRGNISLRKANDNRLVFFSEDYDTRATLPVNDINLGSIRWTGIDSNNVTYLSAYIQNNIMTTGLCGLNIATYDIEEHKVEVLLTVYRDSNNSIIKAFKPSATLGDISLGEGNYRWSQVFANTGTISTSDERVKSNITSISDNVLDIWGEVDWCQFKLNDAVKEKGDKARIHTGLIAQRISTVFASHGLDASRYGLFCHNQWDAKEEKIVDKDAVYEIKTVIDKPEILDENGFVVKDAVTHEEKILIMPEVSHIERKEAGDLYSLRYEECFAMEAAFQRRRADRLESRIVALEAKVH